MKYYAYRKNQAPSDVLERWLKAAEYHNGAVLIVGEPSSLVDHDEDEELENEAMENRFNALGGPRGLKLTRGQGRHIYERHVAQLPEEVT